MTRARRDRNGRFITVCVHTPLGASGRECRTRAQYGIEGYGYSGLRHATRPIYCLRHGRAVLRRLQREGRNTYRLVTVGDGTDWLKDRKEVAR